MTGTTETRAPSEKQIAFAEKLAEKKGANLPEGYLTDSNVCRAFIDAMVVPSDKQLDFAKKIADEQGVGIPAEAMKDSIKLSKWIDENKAGGDSKPKPKK